MLHHFFVETFPTKGTGGLGGLWVPDPFGLGFGGSRRGRLGPCSSLGGTWKVVPVFPDVIPLLVLVDEALVGAKTAPVKDTSLTGDRHATFAQLQEKHHSMKYSLVGI